MFDDTAIVRVLQGQMPLLLVCFGAMGLALANLRRHPKPSILIFIGAGLMFIDIIASVFVWGYLLQPGNASGWFADDHSNFISLFSMSASVIQGIALALIVAAAFVDRKSK